MTEKEKAREWASLYKQSPLKYNMNALLSCYESDGERVLQLTLKELGLELSVELVKDAAKRGA